MFKFFLHSINNLQYKYTSYTTYKIFNDITRTMPLGARYYDYSVASQKTIVNRKGMVRKAFVFQQRCYCLRFPMSRDDEAGSKPGLTKSRNY